MRRLKDYCFILLLIVFIPIPAYAELPAAVDGQMLPSLAPMLDKVTPAVVNISTLTHIEETPFTIDPFFRFFFDSFEDFPKQKRDQQSLGSGVIIDTGKGYVVTNHHVVDKADEIAVTLRDGRQLKAKLVGTDSETDVALLQIPPESLTALPFADSDVLRVGDFVVAIGNPFGLGQTVTSGIVSALGRSGLGIEGYEDFIQTDASINPGNSGGALVNLKGELVGINAAIIAPSGGNVGIGFAIPMNMVKQVVQHLSQFGEVKRGTLGLEVQNLDFELVKAFNLKSNKGAVVTNVVKDSPAQEAGIQAGDVITAINGKPISSSVDVHNRIGLLRIGDNVQLTVTRKEQVYEFKATVEGSKIVKGSQINTFLDGLSLSDTTTGIEIVEVARRSFASTVGFRKGDVIVGFNRLSVKNLAELEQAMKNVSPPFLIQVQRGNELFSVLLR